MQSTMQLVLAAQGLKQRHFSRDCYLQLLCSYSDSKRVGHTGFSLHSSARNISLIALFSVFTIALSPVRAPPLPGKLRYTFVTITYPRPREPPLRVMIRSAFFSCVKMVSSGRTYGKCSTSQAGCTCLELSFLNLFLLRRVVVNAAPWERLRQMMRVRPLLLAFVLMMIPPSLRASDRQPSPRHAVCAASHAHNIATVTASSSTVALQISGPSGVLHLATQTSAPVDECHAFFSDNGNLLAISFTLHTDAVHNMEIAVADLPSAKWISPAPVVPVMPSEFHGFLAGFLKNSNRLVVLDSGSYSALYQKTSLFPLYFAAVPGYPTFPYNSDARSYPGMPLTPVSGYIDTVGNRIWYRGNRAGCDFQSMTLSGEWLEGPSVDLGKLRHAGCHAPDFVSTPDPGTFLIAAVDGPTIHFWSTNLATSDVSTFSLPLDRNGDMYWLSGQGAHSPDGKILAVVTRHFAESRFGGLGAASEELLVLHLGPFRLLGREKLDSDRVHQAIAVDHRDGMATIVTYRGGKWHTAHFRDK